MRSDHKKFKRFHFGNYEKNHTISLEEGSWTPSTLQGPTPPMCQSVRDRGRASNIISPKKNGSKRLGTLYLQKTQEISKGLPFLKHIQLKVEMVKGGHEKPSNKFLIYHRLSFPSCDHPEKGLENSRFQNVLPLSLATSPVSSARQHTSGWEHQGCFTMTCDHLKTQTTPDQGDSTNTTSVMLCFLSS